MVNTVVVRLTLSRKPWDKTGTPGYLPHRPLSPSGSACQVFKPTALLLPWVMLGVFHLLATSSLIALGVAIIIFGGVKRIAHFAQVVVPAMALGYILIAFAVIGANIEQFPAVIKLIVKSAFGLDAGFGAIIGMAVQWGVKRGVYSNEAGQGTAPHAAAAAEVSHPAKQGLVQAFSVYVDTLLICTATAFMILMTGLYNVQGPDGVMLYQGLSGYEAGPAYVQSAFDTVLPGFGSGILAISLLCFAFTTIVAYYYIAETNVMYINRKVHRPWLVLFLKALVLTSVMYGGLKSANIAWALGDIGVGLMAWLNIVAILILQKPAMLALKDYETQLDNGEDPTFDPLKLGIEKADFWVNK